jgi:hypothetical protein
MEKEEKLPCKIYFFDEIEKKKQKNKKNKT